MRALVLRHHGEFDALKLLDDYPDPSPRPGQVVLQVKACALNDRDIFTLRGAPGVRVPLPIVGGIDVAGIIDDVGPDCGDWKVGDRVVVDPIDRKDATGLLGEVRDGGLAERCVVDADSLINLPDDVSFEQAASLPMAYGTAYRLMARGEVKTGDRALILDADSGIGTCCVQLAKAGGAEVIAAASSGEKLARLQALGADHLIDSKSKDFMTEIHRMFGKPRIWGSGGVNVVVNLIGGDTWVPSLRSLQKGGRLLTCGSTAEYDPKEDIRFIWTFELNLTGSNGWERNDLDELIKLTQSRTIVPVIDRVFPLEGATEALRALDRREVFGKVVVIPC